MFRGLRVGYKHRELLLNLTQRELRARYRRSILGWGWSMLNPAMNTAIYTFVFLTIFKSEAPVGDPSGIRVYSIYFLAGVLPWNFFAIGTSTAISSLLGSGALMTKVYFPRELVPASAVLARYGSLEQIPAHAGQWDVPGLRGAAKLCATLVDHLADAVLFRTIATVRRDAITLPDGVEGLRWLGPTDAFSAIAERLESPGLAVRARALSERRRARG